MQRSAGWVLLLALGGGCAWFKELQSADSADDGGSGTGDDAGSDTAGDSGSSGDSGAGACNIVDDDRCGDQDTLLSCDEATGVLTEFACADLCGGSVNFSCVIATSAAQHGCWCVVPGDQKRMSCTELEACLLECSSATSTACADACFERTTAPTIRTYGSLVSCAHHGCDDTCRDEPAACSSCISSAIAAGTGDCVLERSVCDADAPSEPWWPD